MPATMERERLARDIFLLTDRDFNAVAALVEEMLDDDPPLSDEEIRQLDESYEDIRNGRVISWDDVREELEALP